MLLGKKHYWYMSMLLVTVCLPVHMGKKWFSLTPCIKETQSFKIMSKINGNSYLWNYVKTW